MSRLTRDEGDTCFVVLHYGGLDFHAVLRPTDSLEVFERFKRRLFEIADEGSVADITNLVTREFPGQPHRIEDLFADERRRITGVVLADRLEDYRTTFARLAAADADVLLRLGRMRTTIPTAMRVAASVELDSRLADEIGRLEDPTTLEKMRGEIERATLWGYQPERERLQKLLAEKLEEVLRAFHPSADTQHLSAWATRGCSKRPACSTSRSTCGRRRISCSKVSVCWRRGRAERDGADGSDASRRSIENRPADARLRNSLAIVWSIACFQPRMGRHGIARGVSPWETVVCRENTTPRAGPPGAYAPGYTMPPHPGLKCRNGTDYCLTVPESTHGGEYASCRWSR